MVKHSLRATIMAKRRLHIDPMSAAEAEALMKRVDNATREFQGQFDELESALGMLAVGRLVGWKYLTFIHNKRTIKKYEEILGINIREAFPEEGPLISKSKAYTLVKQLGQYWKAVSGEVKVDNRRGLEQT